MIPPEEVAAGARLLLGIDATSSEEELAAGMVRLFGLEAGAIPALAARLAMLLGSGQVIFPPRK